MEKREKIFLFILLGISIVAMGVWGYSIYLKKQVFENLIHSEKSKIQKDIKNIEDKSDKESIKPGAVKVPIIIYHNVKPIYRGSIQQYAFSITPTTLEKHLKYFKEHGYTTISIDLLIDHFNKNIPLPPKPVILTFDDGWENQYIYAFPLLKKYNATAVFYIYTNNIGHKNFLNWKEIKELDAAKMTIGSHTESHLSLTSIKNKEKLIEEIMGSKKIIEENLGETINDFAYPYGHYNKNIMALAKEAGYTSARGTEKGTYHVKDEIFNLAGHIIYDDLDEFINTLDK